MRRIIFLMTVLVLLISCKEKKNAVFTVSGSLKNRTVKMIYLEETRITDFQKTLKDSAVIGANGKFSLKTEPTEESIYNLRIDNEAYPFVSLINDAAVINVHADFKNEKEFYTVTGSDASQIIKDYLNVSGDKLRQIFELIRSTDSLKNNRAESGLIQQTEAKRNSIVAELKNYTQESFQGSKSPVLAMFILSTYQGIANNPTFKLVPFSNEDLVALLNELVNKFPGRTDIASIRNSIESQISKAGLVGKSAPEIALPDTEGRLVKLSSYQGKYVLVDFWASWCAPCRRENPNVVEAFNKYKNKNFTILGVSLDLKKEAWKKAIVDDNLNWTHISDLKQWGSEVVPLYGIQGIPFNVLVNPEGKIIAENLRGEGLDQKLQEVLK